MQTSPLALRAGFAFTPEQDLLFAQGWPHIRFLDPAKLDDEQAVVEAQRCLNPLDPTPRHRWDRRLASALVRGLGVPAVFEIGPDDKSLRTEAEEALWNPSPPSAAEVSAGLWVRMTCSPMGVSDRTMETWVLLAEALVGAQAVASAMVEHLEAMNPALLTTRWTLPPFVTYQLGYLLLRVKPDEAQSLKNRLAKVLARQGGDISSGRAAWEDGFTHLRAIHLVIGGVDAARRGADRNLGWYTHVQDDANFIRMRVAMDRLGYRPDARLIYLGGIEVVGSYARRWQRLNGDDQRWFFQQIAPIQSEAVAGLILEMAVASSVRTEATQWFKDHRSFAVPWLKTQVDADGNTGTVARRLLEGAGN